MMMLAFLAALAAPPSSPLPERETTPGSRIPRPLEKVEREQLEIRKVQTKYGECVVKKQYAAARTFVLLANLEGRDRDRAVAKIANPDCLLGAVTLPGGVQMTFPGDTMRYTLAEALIRREFPGGPPPSLKTAGPIVQPTFDETEYVPPPGKKLKKKELDELAEMRSTRLGQVYLAAYGECVVRADTGNSHAVLMAEPGSTAESSAFRNLLPVFSACLTAGQTLSFGKAVLRGTIAMNLYRLAHAPRIVVPQPTGSR